MLHSSVRALLSWHESFVEKWIKAWRATLLSVLDVME